MAKKGFKKAVGSSMKKSAFAKDTGPAAGKGAKTKMSAAGKHKISKPVNGAGKFKGNVAKGAKTAARKGTSPLDGRKGGK